LPGAAAGPSEVIDVQLQGGMPLGDLLQRRHVSPGQETDGQSRLLARRPEPVERAIGPPRLLVRLVEGEPEPEHARPLAPAGDDALALRALEVEVPEDAELGGVLAHRFDGEHVDGLAERAGRVDHRAIDAGRGHLGERVVDRVRGDLAMVRAHLAVLPEVDLGIDDQHGGPPP
jgi:hypothetical protein